MTTNLGLIVPVVIGSVCLLGVCSVYLWKQSFKLDGLLLLICGAVLLGLPNWQARSGDQALADLTRQFGEIRDAWAGVEAQIAQIAENQRHQALLVGALTETHASAFTACQAEPQTVAGVPDTLPPDSLEIGAIGGVSNDARQAEPQTAAGVPDTLPPDSLEIEAIGGVSDKELGAIVSWIQEIKSERPASVILIEPVMPHESTDLAGQRKRLMNEVGRVMDHVFDEMSQRIGITKLSSENVPGPRLRLHFQASSGWHRDWFRATSEDRTSSQSTQATLAARRPLTRAERGASAPREAQQHAEQGLEPKGEAQWGQEGSVVITFAMNSSYLQPGTSQRLNSLIGSMASGALYRVQLQVGLSGSDKVAGATQPEEAMRYNKWLAERRMNRVKEWLTENARDRQFEIESELLVGDISRRIVVRAMPTS